MGRGYDWMSEELYPQHKVIIDLSYAPAVLLHEEPRSCWLWPFWNCKIAKSLFNDAQPAAAEVFAASATELFLKASLLRPVIHGMIHSDAVAELVVR